MKKGIMGILLGVSLLSISGCSTSQTVAQQSSTASATSASSKPAKQHVTVIARPSKAWLLAHAKGVAQTTPTDGAQARIFLRKMAGFKPAALAKLSDEQLSDFGDKAGLMGYLGTERQALAADSDLQPAPDLLSGAELNWQMSEHNAFAEKVMPQLQTNQTIVGFKPLDKTGTNYRVYARQSGKAGRQVLGTFNLKQAQFNGEPLE